MDGLQLIAAMITSLLAGGGGVAAWFKYRTDNRRIDADEEGGRAERRRSEIEQALDVVVKQRDNALDTVERLNSRIDQLDMEVQGLRLARDLDPFPNWIVDLEGRYVYVNREFELQFLEPVGLSYRQIIGQKHEAIFPAKFATTLRNLDAVARRVPDGSARARTTVSLREVNKDVTVHKFPIRVREGVVAYAGFITEVEEVEAAPLTGKGRKR